MANVNPILPYQQQLIQSEFEAFEGHIVVLQKNGLGRGGGES